MKIVFNETSKYAVLAYGNIHVLSYEKFQEFMNDPILLCTLDLSATYRCDSGLIVFGGYDKNANAFSIVPIHTTLFSNNLICSLMIDGDREFWFADGITDIDERKYKIDETFVLGRLDGNYNGPKQKEI